MLKTCNVPVGTESLGRDSGKHRAGDRRPEEAGAV